MRIGPHETDERILVVAELDAAIGGDASRATSVLELAAASGADAVALSAVVPERLWAADQPRRLEAATSVALAPELVREIATRARDLGLAVILAASDRETLRDMADVASAWRIEAADADFGVLLDAAGGSGLPVLLEVDRPSEDLLEAVVARIHAAAEAGTSAVPGGESRRPVAAAAAAAGAEPTRVTVADADVADGRPASGVVVVHAPPGSGRDDHQALPEMLLLATFGDAVGYCDRPSDAGDATALVAAAALGADVLLRPLESPGQDEGAFSRAVGAVRRVEAMLAVGGGSGHALGPGDATDGDAADGDAADAGSAGSPPPGHPAAAPDAIVMRRVIVTRRALAEGDLVGFEDIDWRRSDRGRPFGDEPLVVGRRVTCDLPAGTPLRESVLASRSDR